MICIYLLIMKACFKNVKKFFSEEEIELMKDFVNYLQNEVTLNKDVTIVFTSKRIGNMTTGMRTTGHLIYVLSKDRLLADVLRTLTHEWIHEFQDQKLGIKEKQKIKDIGGPEENMANVLAGIIMKKFKKEFPNYEDLLFGEK